MGGCGYMGVCVGGVRACVRACVHARVFTDRGEGQCCLTKIFERRETS